jgi:orotate phosphoribosyltransferase
MTKHEWNGEFVFQELGIPHPEDSKDFKKLLGLALRKNKKRAHLLVSTVLGKHIPQQPHIILAAADALAEQITRYELHPHLDADVMRRAARRKVVAYLDGWEAVDAGHYDTTFPSPHVMVFGYAETATSLGAAVARSLSAPYVHSTRYPVPGAVEYGGFEEEHSHATAHHITPQNASMLNNPDSRIVLVDDELTTGQTVMNTISMFEQHTHHQTYYVATLTDLRTSAAVEQFAKFEAETGVEVRVVSLLSVELNIPVDSVAKAEPVIARIKNVPEPELDAVAPGHVFVRSFPSAPKNMSLGVTAQDMLDMEGQAKELLSVAASVTGEKVLVLGIEEDMYFSLLFSDELRKATLQGSVFFSSATRSPVVAHFDEGYAIQDRIMYSVPGEDTSRYVYNVGTQYDRVILITNSKEETLRLENLIEKLTRRTKVVEVLEAKVNVNGLSEPLYGAEFGSYAKNDVSWLLKDLSSVSLEASVEVRERKIQSGEASYAESLPVEFIPSEEYQQLFKDSLNENKAKVAEAVAMLAEQVFIKRSGSPVLVSLARAGTPVGVLMKRYLQKTYKYDAPHYAISIVRGGGIDYNALRYIAAHHNPADVIFVDGWTGKGAIARELEAALDTFAASTGIVFPHELAVLADPGSCVTLYGTREDYLIPSACLNSTISGLVSRTVLNADYIAENDYHGAKFYAEFRDNDVSNLFIDTISEEFTEQLSAQVRELLVDYVPGAPDWSGWAAVEKISEEYGINNVNWVKPGVGETTRVLLRRVPWKVLIRPGSRAALKHIILLAEQRGVPVEEKADLPYACVGLIHPNFNNGNKDDN